MASPRVTAASRAEHVAQLRGVEETNADTLDYKYLAKNKVHRPGDREEIKQLMRKGSNKKWTPLTRSTMREYTCEDRREDKQECGKRCPKGEKCENSRMFRGEGIATEVKDECDTKGKGRGLFARGNAGPGDLVVEYTGRLHLRDEFFASREKWPADKKAIGYHISICPGVILDPTWEGNSAKYANSSCEPNCELETWEVDGDLRFGLVVAQGKSLRDGQEITWNYGSDYSDTDPKIEPMRCECGELACIGFMTSKSNAERWRKKLRLEKDFLARQEKLKQREKEVRRLSKLHEKEGEEEDEDDRKKVTVRRKRSCGNYGLRGRGIEEEKENEEQEESSSNDQSPESENDNEQQQQITRQKRREPRSKPVNDSRTLNSKRAAPTPPTSSAPYVGPGTRRAAEESDQPDHRETAAGSRPERARKQPSWLSKQTYHQSQSRRITTTTLARRKRKYDVWNLCDHLSMSNMSMESCMAAYLISNKSTKIAMTKYSRRIKRKPGVWHPSCHDVVSSKSIEHVMAEYLDTNPLAASLNVRPSPSQDAQRLNGHSSLPALTPASMNSEQSGSSELPNEKRARKPNSKYL